ncbi:MAG: hypothetical protein HOV66_24355, partial [Streptomycetaceae bacterium]|nr:hypothetical protein [Streptomycetaceae bacterium]
MTDNNSSPRPAERWVGLLIAGVTALAAVGGTVAGFIALNRPDKPDSAAAAAT